MKCRSCKSNNLTKVISLGDQHLSDFRDDDKLPPKYPLDLLFCNKCTLVQLKNTVPGKFLYHDNYGFKSGVNNTIKNDLAEIVRKAQGEVRLDYLDSVIDIGCNDGTLLSNYTDSVFRVGFDPVKKFKKEASKHADKIFSTYFSARKYRYDKAKIITSISMFYDLDDPNSFVKDVKKILHKNGVWIIQMNYLGAMIRNNAYDNISHEHIEYYSLLSLENLLRSHDLEVYKVEKNDINGGSFRVYISHKKAKPIHNSVYQMRVDEKRSKLNTTKVYITFNDTIKRTAWDLYETIHDINVEGKKVYIWGASTRGLVILQKANLDNKLLLAAVERNPEKVGKKISALQIPIISEEEAREHPPDYMLILPYFFAQEIITRERDLINKGVKAIVPLPEVNIIDDTFYKPFSSEMWRIPVRPTHR